MNLTSDEEVAEIPAEEPQVPESPASVTADTEVPVDTPTGAAVPAELTAALARIAELERDAMHRRVSDETGIPVAIVAQLVGDEDAVLKAAEAVVALMVAVPDGPASRLSKPRLVAGAIGVDDRAEPSLGALMTAVSRGV